MKRIIVMVIVAITFALTTSNAQSFKIVNGQITKVKKDTTKTKKIDKVYKIVDGITFYQGEKGGVYYWKISKKTGLKYKSYLK